MELDGGLEGCGHLLTSWGACSPASAAVLGGAESGGVRRGAEQRAALTVSAKLHMLSVFSSSPWWPHRSGWAAMLWGRWTQLKTLALGTQLCALGELLRVWRPGRRPSEAGRPQLAQGFEVGRGCVR